LANLFARAVKVGALGRPFMLLHHHPVGQDAGLQIAADDPEHPAFSDPVLQPSHQHVMVRGGNIFSKSMSTTQRLRS
jgi:hypothetical protein